MSTQQPAYSDALSRLKFELRERRVTDLIGYAAAWAVGIGFCVVAASLLGFMFYKGIQYMSFDLLVTSPQVSDDPKKTGGFLDPILGTLMLVAIGTLIALPLAVGAAIWVVEYGKPAGLARIVESAIEMIAGAPSIVIGIFGATIFEAKFMGWASLVSAEGQAYGRSFIAAGTMLSLIAVPSIFAATRGALLSIPQHLREASYALGKTRWSTILRVLLPNLRSSIATGAALGMGRIAGDTAIIVVLLGADLKFDPEGSVPGFDVLRGTGSSMTSYVFQNSPAGEGNAPERAYAAAFVLLLLVLAINLLVGVFARRDNSKALAK